MPKKGERMSDEQRGRIQMALKAHWKENQDKRVEYSESRMGHPVSTKTIEQIKRYNATRVMTDEQRQHLREARKKQWENPEFRARIAKTRDATGWRDKLRTPESSAKKSAAKKADWASLSAEDRSKRLAHLASIRPAAIEAGRYVPRKRGIPRPTSLEIAIQAVLDALGIEYVKEHQIGRFFADFYIPSRQLVIECDGAYWHSLPGAAEADKERDEWITTQGYRVIRLAQVDIQRDAKACVDLALSG